MPIRKRSHNSRLEEIREKFYKDIDKEIFYNILKMDPTTIVKGDEVMKMGNYCKWLLILYKKNELQLDDHDKINEYLIAFNEVRYMKSLLERLNKKIGDPKISTVEVEKLISKRTKIEKLKIDPDIMKYKSHGDLYLALKDYLEDEEEEEEEIEETDIEKYIKTVQTKVLYKDSNWMYILPLSYDAAAFWGRGTKWCTTGKGAFTNYKQLHIIINRKSKDEKGRTEKYQFEFGSHQFMDVHDKSINKQQLLAKLPEKMIEIILNEKLKDVLKYDNSTKLVGDKILIEGDDFLYFKFVFDLSIQKKIDTSLKNKYELNDEIIKLIEPYFSADWQQKYKTPEKAIENDKTLKIFLQKTFSEAQRYQIEDDIRKSLEKHYKFTIIPGKVSLIVDAIKFFDEIFNINYDISDLFKNIKYVPSTFRLEEFFIQLLKENISQLEKTASIDKSANFDKDVAPSTKKFWKNIRNDKTHEFGKHPIFAVYGEQLSQEGYEDIKNRKEEVNLPDGHMVLMELFQRIMMEEHQHKKQLEDLAVRAVAEVWGIDEKRIRAQLTQHVDINTTVEDLSDEDFEELIEETPGFRKLVNKRLSLNSLVHGSAVNAMLTLHKFLMQELNQISPELVDLYDKISVGSYRMYWTFDFSGMGLGQMAAGSSKVEYEKNSEGEEQSVVIAKAFIFPVLVQELCKGVAEMITHHGLSGIDEKTLKNVLIKADDIKHEPWLIQIGTQMWRKFSKAIQDMNARRELKIPVAKILMFLSQEDPDTVHKVIEACIDYPKEAADLLDAIIIKKENLREMLEDLENPDEEDLAEDPDDWKNG
jgi:hypothetical protein